YTLDERASDAASRKLAERHDRGDILSGVDLTAKSDTVARVLLDLARNETSHRTDGLADALVSELDKRVELHKRPRLTAGFSVLKSADIPSVLIELGFLNSPGDMANISNAEWRANASAGIVAGLQSWAQSDAAERNLRLK
ncbi:MAG: N-acetylmuramoyl-L-alanine amidase, partial [Silicimonas sp.]|nr:N-acetylmuramoyl-L-alanine amidase [Silicimonas sp.]